MLSLLPRLAAYSLLFCAAPAWADPVVINAAKDYSPEDIAAVEKTGAGLSGPGVPVVGDGVVGGFAVGTPVTPENRAKLASNSAVAHGLLPSIKPVGMCICATQTSSSATTAAIT